MNLALNKAWTYLFALLYVALCLVGFYYDFPYIVGLPLVPVFVHVLLHHTDKVLIGLAFATPISIPVNDIGAGIGMSLPTEPLIALMLVGFLFKFLLGNKLSVEVLKNPIVMVSLVTLLWMYITSATSTHPLVSVKYSLAYTWYIFIFLILLAHQFKRTSFIKAFIWAFALGTTILTLYTLKNHAAEGFTRLYAYTAMRPFIPDHGMYAAAISFALPVMMVFGILGRRMKLPWLVIMVALGVALVVTLGVIFSFTRASWLSLVVAFGVYVLLLFRVKFKTVAAIGGISLGLFILFQSLIFSELARNKQDSDDDIFAHLQSFSNISTDPSNLERLNRWSCAYRMVQDKPLTGFGPGTYTYEYGPYQLPYEMSIISTNAGDLGNVHSEYLRPFAESGIIGGLLFFILVIVTVQQGFEVYYRLQDFKLKGIVMGVLLGLITYFVHGFLNNYSDFDKIAVPMWRFMAVLVAMKAYHLGSPTEQDS